MTISLQLEPHATYLTAVVGGAFALDEAQAVSVRFTQACAKHGLAKVLVDFRGLQGHITITERFLYSEFMARLVIEQSVQQSGRPVMLAYLGDESMLDPNRFGLLVARNRGVLAIATSSLNE